MKSDYAGQRPFQLGLDGFSGARRSFWKSTLARIASEGDLGETPLFARGRFPGSTSSQYSLIIGLPYREPYLYPFWPLTAEPLASSSMGGQGDTV